jgi:hypothetical protein
LSGTACLVLFAGLAAQESAAPPALRGLDHIPIAVNDLAAAASRYRALGFSLKPGRPHPNGIRNEHAKFPDGTELELITAPEAKDNLTAQYRRHLESGDGPAFLAFFAPDRDVVSRRLAEVRQQHALTPPYVTGLGGDLSYVFVGPRNASPTDRPEHFAHANTARAFVAVWLAADDLSAERGFLRALGATFAKRPVHVPDRVNTTVARLPEGEVVLLPGSRQITPGRRIVGATLLVRSLDAAVKVLEGGPFGGDLRRVRNERGRSVFIPPAAAHGLWIELREPAAT